MRTFVVLLVVVGLLFVASLYLAGGAQSGDPNTVFTSVAGQSLVQSITDRFATRLDPSTLHDVHVQGNSLDVAGGVTATVVIPSSTEQYRRMDFTGVAQPVQLTYVDSMKDGNGATQTQAWQWPVSANNAKLSASEQGGLLTVHCKAAAPQSCSLTFR